MDATTALIILFAFIGLLVFLSLSFTAIFRPDHLRTLERALASQIKERYTVTHKAARRKKTCLTGENVAST